MNTKEYTREELFKLTSELKLELNKMPMKELLDFRRDWVKELVHIRANAAVVRLCLDLVDRVIQHKTEE